MFIKIKNIDFLGGAQSFSALPQCSIPEVAIIGRSNVGKSTLVNRLTGRHKLARTSQTPGRTTEINLFSLLLALEQDSAEEKELQLILADLPGFGYSKFAKTQREKLSQLTVEYIRNRPHLTTICLLNDCRRDPEDDELAIRDIAFAANVHLLVVLTKMDKLNQKEKHARPKAIAECYNLTTSDLIASGEKTPIQHLWERIIAVSVE